MLTCGVFRTEAGLEVRCGYGEDNLIRSQYGVEIGAGRALANDWKSAAKLKGWALIEDGTKQDAPISVGGWSHRLAVHRGRPSRVSRRAHTGHIGSTRRACWGYSFQSSAPWCGIEDKGDGAWHQTLGKLR